MRTILLLFALCSNAIAAPYANVKIDYGAVGDGVTDDRVAFQRALDETTGTLYIPAGVYLLSQAPNKYWALHPNHRVQVVGESRDTVTLEMAPGAGPSVQLFWIESVDGVAFSNVTLDGLAEQQSVNPQRHGLFVKHSNNFSLDNVVLRNFTGDGIHVHDGSSGTLVLNSTFTNNRRNGFTLGGNTNRSTFVGNNFIGNYAEGLDSEHGIANNVIVVKNIFDTLDHSTDFVLTVTGDIERSKNWTITDNWVNGSVLIMRVTDVVYARNRGTNTTPLPSIYIYRNTDRIRVEDNELTTTKDARFDGGAMVHVLGVDVGQSPGGIVVERNTFTTSAKAYGIALICVRDAIVANNSFMGGGIQDKYEAGVYIRATRVLEPVNYISITRNIFTNFGAYGLVVNGNGLAQIKKLEIVDNSFINMAGPMNTGLNLNDGTNALQDTYVSGNTYYNIATEMVHPPAGVLQQLEGQRWLQ